MQSTFHVFPYYRKKVNHVFHTVMYIFQLILVICLYSHIMKNTPTQKFVLRFRLSIWHFFSYGNLIAHYKHQEAGVENGDKQFHFFPTKQHYSAAKKKQ